MMNMIIGGFDASEGYTGLTPSVEIEISMMMQLIFGSKEKKTILSIRNYKDQASHERDDEFGKKVEKCRVKINLSKVTPLNNPSINIYDWGSLQDKCIQSNTLVFLFFFTFTEMR